jgi:hypothetical protein
VAIKRQNLEAPKGIGEWTNLDTVGDVKRFLRWLVLSTGGDKMESKKSSVLGQLSLYLLKTMEVSDMEARLNEMEQRLDRTQGNHQHDNSNSTSTH